MKKYIYTVLAISLFSINGLRAQSINFGAGVATSFLGQRATNEIIDRYNVTRPWLDKKMSKPNPFSGYSFFIGKDQGAFTVHLGINTQKSVVRAEGTTPTGDFGMRELMIRSSFWSINMLYDFADGEDFGLGLNIGGAFGGGDYYTRTSVDEEFRKITNTGYDGAGMFIGIFYEKYLLGDYEGGIAFRVTPYYRGWPKLNIADADEVLQELDPVNVGVPLENRFNTHHSLGIKAELSFRIPR